MTEQKNQRTKTVLVIGLIMVLSLGTTMAQNQQPYEVPSDLASLPYEVDVVVEKIQTSIESPDERNEYAHMIMAYQGFPSIQVGDDLSTAQEEDLALWVKNNPSAIEALLIAQKKNYDEFLKQGIDLENQ